VRKEIGYIFLNLCILSDEFICKLAETPGITSSFIELINLPDVEMVELGLRWSSILLKVHPRGKEMFEEQGGVIALEDLEYNPYKTEKVFEFWFS
jgi:hypothetical protein